ncbi:hypothetical protein [Actinokineospora inagensis]|uniref:hypothetical protein n=1 Tax=Actinokineospora inagensis TaxID=103730 RepID=UPI00041D559A|nr:hypothetical protein [Actinokineospora inagensis]
MTESMGPGDVDDVADEFWVDVSGEVLSEAELAHVLATPVLAAELAEVRRPVSPPTTALVDGTARVRRDARIAGRGAGAVSATRCPTCEWPGGHAPWCPHGAAVAA